MKSQRHLEVKLLKYIRNEALKHSTLLIIVILITCYVRNEQIQRSTEDNLRSRGMLCQWISFMTPAVLAHK